MSVATRPGRIDQTDRRSRRAVSPPRQATSRDGVAAGRAARRRLPVKLQGEWRPAPGRDPVTLIERQAQTFVPELVGIRYGRMLKSPFSFYRGAAIVMAADLARTPNSGLRVQLCGNAHLANFGGFASAERNLVFDINGFDETLPGPWEWDVKRLAASVEIKARELDISVKKRRSLVRSLVDEYQAAMNLFAGLGYMAVWYAQLGMAGISDRWAAQIKSRTLKRLERAQDHARGTRYAYERRIRMVRGRARFVNHPPLIVRVEDLIQSEEATLFDQQMRRNIDAYRESLPADRQQILARFTFSDSARRVVGVGGVGIHTTVILLTSDSSESLVLQVKEARRSVLEPYVGRSHYSHSGQRVVEGQRLMQASSDILLGWMRGPGLYGVVHDYYVRQLWDRKISPDFAAMNSEDLQLFGRACAWTLARAHARSGDRIAIASYLGVTEHLPDAIDQFAVAYADQTERDFSAFVDAADRGRIFTATDLS